MLPLRPDNKHVFDTIFQILGTSIKRFNQAMTFPVRILQILRGTEHAAASVATGILLLHEEYGISSVFSILIKSIVDALKLDSSDSDTVSNHASPCPRTRPAAAFAAFPIPCHGFRTCNQW